MTGRHDAVCELDRVPPVGVFGDSASQVSCSILDRHGGWDCNAADQWTHPRRNRLRHPRDEGEMSRTCRHDEVPRQRVRTATKSRTATR